MLCAFSIGFTSSFICLRLSTICSAKRFTSAFDAFSAPSLPIVTPSYPDCANVDINALSAVILWSDPAVAEAAAFAFVGVSDDGDPVVDPDGGAGLGDFGYCAKAGAASALTHDATINIRFIELLQACYRKPPSSECLDEPRTGLAA